MSEFGTSVGPAISWDQYRIAWLQVPDKMKILKLVRVLKQSFPSNPLSSKRNEKAIVVVPLGPHIHGTWYQIPTLREFFAFSKFFFSLFLFSSHHLHPSLHHSIYSIHLIIINIILMISNDKKKERGLKKKGIKNGCLVNELVRLCSIKQ